MMLNSGSANAAEIGRQPREQRDNMRSHFLKLFAGCMLLCTVLAGRAAAQTGMDFEDWQPKLDPYFAEELIGDVKRQLPRGAKFKIWGWDVGDYSGDGYNDCAVTIRMANERKRLVHVYFFVDIDGYLTCVGQTERTFIEVPLEAGISIKDNACYVLRKHRQYTWDIQGYRFDNGALTVLDDFSTERLKFTTHESYRNYHTLFGYERYVNNRSGNEEHLVEFLCIPSYRRGRYIYKGYTSELQSSSVRFVPQGAYYWEGEDDASFRVRSAYNDEFLYFIVTVRDDIIVPDNGNFITWDGIQIWLDASNRPNRHLKTDDERDFRTTADSGIFCFNINPGNYAERRPEYSVSATDDVNELQNYALAQVRVRSNLTEDGYQVKIRIPFQFLGFEGAPVSEESISELGCTIVVNDIDNGFRPEEETWIATSKFEQLNPSSYGSLLLVPNTLGYGEADNIYSDALSDRLNELGF